MGHATAKPSKGAPAKPPQVQSKQLPASLSTWEDPLTGMSVDALDAAALDAVGRKLVMSRDEERERTMREHPDLISKCVEVASPPALYVLQLLATAPGNRATLAVAPRVLDVAFACADNANMPMQARVSSLHLVGHLLMDEPTCKVVVRHEARMSVLLRCSGLTDEYAQSAAVGAIQNASVFAAVQPLLDTPLVISSLQPLVFSVRANVAQRAALTLANIIGTDESRSDMLTKDSRALKYALDVLLVAMDAPGSWPLSTPLVSLRSLSLVKSNREYFLARGALDLLRRALAIAITARDFRSLDLGIGTVQQFCFEAEGVTAVKASGIADEVIPSILKLDAAASGDFSLQSAQKSTQYVSFALSGGLRHLSPGSAAQGQGIRVMVSYSWNDQAIARRIDAAFTEAGLRVWRDEHDIKGSIIDAMCTAVLESELFVCLVSSSYYKSGNCRSELEFARANRKRIIPLLVEENYRFNDNWLGFLLASALFYPVVPESKFQAGLAQFFEKEVTMLPQGVSAASAAVSNSSNVAAPRISSSHRTRIKEGLPVPATEAAIVSWLEESQFGALVEVLRNNGFTADAKTFMTLVHLEVGEISKAMAISLASAAKLKVALSTSFASPWEDQDES